MSSRRSDSHKRPFARAGSKRAGRRPSRSGPALRTRSHPKMSGRRPPPARRAARAAGQSRAPTTPAASPRCRSRRRSCGCRTRPTEGRGSPGGPASRYPPGIYDPTGLGKLLFGFFAAMAETERENVREPTLEGLETAARKGKYGGRPPVITDDMLHTVQRRKALGESVEQIQTDLIILTGKRKGQNPSAASIYRALAEHEKTQAYLEAVETAHADSAALQQRDHSPVQSLSAACLFAVVVREQGRAGGWKCRTPPRRRPGHRSRPRPGRGSAGQSNAGRSNAGQLTAGRSNAGRSTPACGRDWPRCSPLLSVHRTSGVT